MRIYNRAKKKNELNHLEKKAEKTSSTALENLDLESSSEEEDEDALYHSCEPETNIVETESNLTLPRDLVTSTLNTALRLGLSS